ncbi:MAG TPA: hypothetical protein VI386_04435 [Candidatus Sulfotelmatobacter sp.]
MKSFRYLSVLCLGLAFATGAKAQIFYDNTTPVQLFPGAFSTTDEIADDTPFTGTHHVASFSFAYINSNPGAVNATVRFYTVNAATGNPGDLVATIPVTGLAPGSFFHTVNLTPDQQFDWTATPGIYGSSATGGFVSVQYTGADFEQGTYIAGTVSLDDVFNVTTGLRENFSGDINASFSMQISSSATAPVLTTFTVNPTTVKGGGNTFATITLTAPAPAGGALVTLKSGKPTVAQIPASVRIPAGATTAKVMIKTQAAQSSTLVTFSATYRALRIVSLNITK